MIDSITRITLNLQETNTMESIKAKRGDTSRKLLIHLSDGSIPYHISDECYATFTAKKPDGTKINNACTIENNVIEYEFTPQTCSAVGTMKAEIKLYGSDDKMITSACFLITVYETVFKDGDEISSEDEMNTLDDLILRANEFLNESGKLLRWMGTWNIDAEYETNDLVLYEDVLYVAEDAVAAGVEPGSEEAAWVPIAGMGTGSGGEAVGIASVEQTYTAGSGGVNIVTVKLTDGTESEIKIRNGIPGASIQGPQGERGPMGPRGYTGETGPQGPAGPAGDDYVLTDADKAEIAEMAAGLVEVPDSGGNVDLNGVVKSVNGITPDENGNVDITVSGTATAIDYDQNVHSVNHRGYSASAPENTIPAYILSKQMGFTYAEADVSFTSDGVAVLLHDATIDRTSNGSGSISAMTYAEASKYDYGSWKNTKYTGTRIPTFEEFIILCKRIGLHPYIELKQNGSYTEAQIQTLVEMVKNCGMDGKVTWISFAPSYLGYVKAANPSARLGYLVSSVTSAVITTAQGLQTDTNEVFIDSSDYDADAVSLCQAAGLPLEIWTINSTSTIQNMNAYITGVTSDNLIAGKILYDAGMVYEYGIDEDNPVVPDEPDNPEPDGDEWNKVQFTEVEGYYNTSGVLTPFPNVYNTGILGVGTATKIQFTTTNSDAHYVVFFDSSKNVISSTNYKTVGTHVVDIPDNVGFFTVAYYENERDTFNLSANGVIGNADATLTSISATYSGGNVAVGTNVTALTGIVVTAHYSDGTTTPVTGYTLSGTITEGANTVTVSYGGKTTTFSVTGVAESGGGGETEDTTGWQDGKFYFNLVQGGIWAEVSKGYLQTRTDRVSYVGTGCTITPGKSYRLVGVDGVRYGVHTIIEAGYAEILNNSDLTTANKLDSGWQNSGYEFVAASSAACVWLTASFTSSNITPEQAVPVYLEEIS